MGRRRRKEVKIPKKTLPEFYPCPKCGKNTVLVRLVRKTGVAWITCGSCGLKTSLQVGNNIDEVDAYNIFIDKYYEVGEEIALNE